MKLRIGTRGSRLALAQTQWVVDRLLRAYPEIECETVVITTKGDRILDRPLWEIGDKGLFVGQIEQRLRDGSIDLAVHSMKDMPSELESGLCFARVWPREDRRDALVLRKASSLEALPSGARIATGSKRRAGQLLRLRSDLDIRDIRGNVETRLRKLESEELDGLILAAAGLVRLGLLDRVTEYFEPEILLPAPAQGALALEVRQRDLPLMALLNALADPQADREVRAERAFLAGVGGSCHIPVGASARQEGGELILDALLGTEDIEPLVRCQVRGPAVDPTLLGQKAAAQLLRCLQKAKEGET